MQEVAILGLGIMGSGMAHNLLKAGFSLTVYNRSRDKATALESAGARVADTPRAAVESADVIVAMVANDEASRAIWLGDDGALAGVRSDALLIECSTLTTGWVRELADLAQQRAAVFLDAPVTGSKPVAESGQLGFLVGGDSAAFERARRFQRLGLIAAAVIDRERKPGLEQIMRHTAAHNAESQKCNLLHDQLLRSFSLYHRIRSPDIS
ncbi:MAG TPA: NAD(P)-dependent oxidoreductase, partial [Herpetosiphonaceae bacterium]